MKKHTITTIGLGLALSLTACKKTDVQAGSANTAASVESVKASPWRTVDGWSVEAAEGYSVYNKTIQDATISEDVASSGLVLVFKRGTNEATALPVEEKATGKSYFWYYQVSECTLAINADAYGSTKSPGAENICYYVLNSAKLAELEKKGYSKAELMRLSYENAAALLK